MALAKNKTVKSALAYVEKHPEWPEDSKRLDMPIWEFVARNLFEHANNPDSRVVGSVGRATRAARIILDRTTGTRRSGTAPAARIDKTVTFKGLGTAPRNEEEPREGSSI